MLKRNFYEHDCNYLHLCDRKTKQEAEDAASLYSQESVKLCEDETNKPKIIERRLFEIRCIAQALHHSTPFGSDLYYMMSDIVADVSVLERLPISQVRMKCKDTSQRYEMIINTLPKEQQPYLKQMIESLTQLDQLIILLNIKQE